MDQKLPLRYFYYYYCYQYSSQSVDTVRWWYFDRFVVNIMVAVIVATLSVVDDDDRDNIASFFFVSQGLAFNTTNLYLLCQLFCCTGTGSSRPMVERKIDRCCTLLSHVKRRTAGQTGIKMRMTYSVFMNKDFPSLPRRVSLMYVPVSSRQ